MFGASLLLALRAIRRHLLRSFLTVLGIVIGVAAVITMVTVGNGVTSSISSQISALGANTLMIVPNTQGRAAGSGAPRQFNVSDVDAIREQVGGVKEVAGQRQITVAAMANGVKWSSTALGTSDAGLDVQNMTVTEGRRFTDDEESAGKAVCIIGPTVQKNLFQGQDPIGVAAIASISLIVGGIGIVNIMLVSVTERTREIGIRLAIGALAGEVRLQFLTEAVVLCSLGGAVGIVLAVVLSYAITGLIGVELMIDPAVVVGSLAFSSFLGVVFGYVPAQRASALNPIEALRHE